MILGPLKTSFLCLEKLRYLQRKLLKRQITFIGGLGTSRGKVGKVCIRAKWPTRAELIPVSAAWSDWEYFYSSLDGMLVHRRVTPSIKFAGTHLYTWVERGTVRVKCLAQEHNAMTPTRARTRAARPGDERTKHEATTAPTMGTGRRNRLFPNQWNIQQLPSIVSLLLSLGLVLYQFSWNLLSRNCSHFWKNSYYR